VQRLDRLKAAGATLPPFPFLDGYRLGEHLAYVHRLLDWAEQHAVAIVLVDMPTSADLERRFSSEFAAYRSALAELERSRGVRVLRGNRQALGLGDADFADLIHLNAQGRERFCAWLRNRLTAESAENTQ